MEELQQSPRLVRFGVFEVNLEAAELRKLGERIKLQDKPFQALVLLLDRVGELVTREELCERLWPASTFVEFDDNLNATVKRLRQALNDSADNPRFVETIPRRGYRFIPPIERVNPQAPSPTPEPIVLPPLPVKSNLALRGKFLIAALGLGVLLVLTTAVLWRSEKRREAQPAREIVLAVLPFANLSGDPDRDFLSDGMTENLITQLERLYPQRLAVIARDSAVRYKNTNADTRQIGRELGVEYLLNGTLNRDTKGLFITAELVHAADQTRIWTETFRLPLQETLVEIGVTSRLIESLALKLPKVDKAELSRAGTGNTEALEAYLRGLYAWRQETETGFRNSVDYFEQALRCDPKYAVAYAGLARTYLSLGEHHFVAPGMAESKADEAISQGLRLDPAISDFYMLRADMFSRQDGNHEQVEADFRRAIELDANNAETHEKYALYLRERRTNDAVAEIEKAHQLNPLSPWVNACLGWVLVSAGRLDEAATQLELALRMDPALPATMKFLADLEQKRGRTGEAIAWLEKAADVSGRTPRFLYYLARANAKAGREENVRNLLNELRTESQRQYVDPDYISALQGMVGG